MIGIVAGNYDALEDKPRNKRSSWSSSSNPGDDHRFPIKADERLMSRWEGPFWLAIRYFRPTSSRRSPRSVDRENQFGSREFADETTGKYSVRVESQMTFEGLSQRRPAVHISDRSCSVGRINQTALVHFR